MSQWRVSDMALALLTALAVLGAWEGYVLNHRPESQGCGGDFLQFYTAGRIANDECRVSNVEQRTFDIRHSTFHTRLYDQEYFRSLQATQREDPQRSLYPPTLGLAMAPLARLSSAAALRAWWLLQALCLAACGTIFYRTTPLPRHLRINMLVGLAALVPLWIGVGIGHLAPMLLLVLTVGLTLHRQNRRILAGVILALLAVKPQLAAGLTVWMLLRRDVRTIAGLLVGGAIQFAVVALTLGPGIWLDYLHALPGIAASTRAYVYSPLFEQSFAGIASNLVDAVRLPALKIPAMRIAYTVTSAVAAVALCRVVAARRPFSAISLVPEESSGRSACRRNYEYASGVLFMTIFPPYFLVYDQTLLAFALVMLWASPGWRWGVLLLAVSAVPLANLSFALGFSVTGVAALATMISLAREASRSAARASRSARNKLSAPQVATARLT